MPGVKVLRIAWLMYVIPSVVGERGCYVDLIALGVGHAHQFGACESSTSRPSVGSRPSRLRPAILGRIARLGRVVATLRSE